jgi:hypothetical protein
VTPPSEAADHHASAAFHHEQAARHHREASRHFTSGKDYAHGAHQAWMAHGHAMQAISHAGAAKLPGDETDPQSAAPSQENASPRPRPVFEDVTTIGTNLTRAEHHALAADHHEKAAGQHAEAARHLGAGAQELAGDAAKSAQHHGQYAVFHGDEAAKHHVRQSAKPGPTLDLA